MAAKKEAATGTVKITQTGSPIRRTKDQRSTLIGLGLNKMHRTDQRGTLVLGAADRRAGLGDLHRAGCGFLLGCHVDYSAIAKLPHMVEVVS